MSMLSPILMYDALFIELVLYFNSLISSAISTIDKVLPTSFPVCFSLSNKSNFSFTSFLVSP